MAKHTTSRSRLVNGCGTILKTDRLKGGYELVKRKRKVKGTTSATGKKRGRPAKVKVEEVVMVSVPAPAKRRGRPAKAKMTASAPVSAPAKKRGRPAKAKMTVSAPAKRKVGRPKGSTNMRKTRRRAKKTMA